MLGLATELLWLYEDINKKKKVIIETHPLFNDPAPNQTIGFYLTPRSPVLMLKINYLDTNEMVTVDDIDEIFIRHKDTNQFYCIKNPSEENDIENSCNCLEPFELSSRNLVDIAVLNKQEIIVNNSIKSVIIEINHKGLKDFATMLLVWINNCCDNDEYLIAQNGLDKKGYNLGILLTSDSVPIKLRISDLGTVYEYDSRM